MRRGARDRLAPLCASATTTCATRLNIQTPGCPQRPVGSYFMRLCYKLGIAAVVLLLPRISAYPASTRNEIDSDPVVSLMRAEAPRCAVVCGIGCIRPWAPFNDTAFPMPDQGGLFGCLQSVAVPPHPSDASGKPMFQPIWGRALALPALLGNQRPNRFLWRQESATRRTR